MLAGLLGYREAPTPLELIGYFGYLIPVLILFVWGGRVRRRGLGTDGRIGSGAGLTPARTLAGRQASSDAPQIASGPLDARQREEVAAADRLDVLLERLAVEPVLDGHEAALEVALEGDEEQPLVEQARAVEPAAEGVAAPEDAAGLGLGRPRVGQPDVGVERDPLAVRIVAVVRDRPPRGACPAARRSAWCGR